MSALGALPCPAGTMRTMSTASLTVLQRQLDAGPPPAWVDATWAAVGDQPGVASAFALSAELTPAVLASLRAHKDPAIRAALIVNRHLPVTVATGLVAAEERAAVLCKVADWMRDLHWHPHRRELVAALAASLRARPRMQVATALLGCDDALSDADAVLVARVVLNRRRSLRCVSHENTLAGLLGRAARLVEDDTLWLATTNPAHLVALLTQRPAHLPRTAEGWEHAVSVLIDGVVHTHTEAIRTGTGTKTCADLADTFRTAATVLLTTDAAPAWLSARVEAAVTGSLLDEPLRADVLGLVAVHRFRHPAKPCTIEDLRRRLLAGDETANNDIAIHPDATPQERRTAFDALPVAARGVLLPHLDPELRRLAALERPEMVLTHGLDVVGEDPTATARWLVRELLRDADGQPGRLQGMDMRRLDLTCDIAIAGGAGAVAELPWPLVVKQMRPHWYRQSEALAAAVTELQVIALGDDAGQWRLFYALGDSFSGSVRELIDTVAAVAS